MEDNEEESDVEATFSRDGAALHACDASLTFDYASLFDLDGHLLDHLPPSPDHLALAQQVDTKVGPPHVDAAIDLRLGTAKLTAPSSLPPKETRECVRAAE
jgi:hypothetical protein